MRIRTTAGRRWLQGLGTMALLGTAGCAGVDNGAGVRSHAPEDIIGIEWQWLGTVTPVERITVDQPDRYTLTLEPGGRARVKFDCNNGGGSYTIEQNRISFGPLMATRMACPPDSLDARFSTDLQRAALFFVESGMLYIDLPVDSGTMRFRPAQP